MIHLYRGYTYTYDRWQGYYEIAFRGEIIERADTTAEARKKIDGYHDSAA